MAESEDRRETDSGIEIEPVYTPADVPDVDAELPGEFPFTRGPYSTMYRGRPWTIRQYAGFGSAEETNERFRYLLELGQTGLSVAFDLPTQLGYDSDDPVAQGEVGRTGVAIDSIADMRVLFDGIPLDRVSTSMTINAPAALLLLLYELAAEEQGVPGDKLRGTVQNDILKEYIARGNYIFPPRPSMRITTDLFAYCADRLPLLNTISISGYHIREAGSTAVQELAFTVANGIAYCEAAVAAGLVARRVRRARLVLLQRPQRLPPGGCEVPRGPPAVGTRHAGAVRRHESEGARTALPCADRRLDAHRPAAGAQHRPRRGAGAGGGLGGAQSLHTNSFDEALALPTERAARIALRTQQVLQHEVGTTPTADPLGGSYAVEALTRELEERAWELIERIDELGGAVAAVEQGFVQHEIEEAAFRFARDVEQGERVVVGVNRYEDDGAGGEIELQRIDPEIERRQLERTARVRAERDAEAAARALAEVRSAAEGTGNLLVPMREALRAHCTIGEICDELRDLFGTYDSQRPAA